MKCCICDTAEHEMDYRELRGRWRLVRCGRCGLVYLKNPPAGAGRDFIGAALKSVEEKAPGEPAGEVEYWSVPSLYEKHRAVFERFFRRRLAAISRCRGGAPESLLDVGCGYGFFMDYCRERGVRARGLDVSGEAVSWAVEGLGLDAAVAEVESFEPGETFDAFVMCDVLEHLPEPAAALKRMREWGAGGAVYYIQAPNTLGLKYPAGATYNEPYHLWHFGARTLRRLVESCGFEVAGWQFGVMGVIGVYERGGVTAARRAMWEAASRLRFGNRMAVIARKK